MPYTPLLLLSEPVPPDIAVLVGGGLVAGMGVLWRWGIGANNRLLDKTEANAREVIEALHHSADADTQLARAMESLAKMVEECASKQEAS